MPEKNTPSVPPIHPFIHSSIYPIWPQAKWWGHPFSRSYGANVPSSLERFLSRALVYSTHPPVSVCGTGDGGNTGGLFSALVSVMRFGQSPKLSIRLPNHLHSCVIHPA